MCYLSLRLVRLLSLRTCLFGLSAHRLLFNGHVLNVDPNMFKCSYVARLRLSFKTRTSLISYFLESGDFMNDLLQYLFVGIDVSKENNQVYAMNFSQEKLASFSTPNHQSGANLLEEKLLDILDRHHLSKIIIAMESTGIYSAHIATYLSASKFLFPFEVKVYVLNPKISRNYRHSFSDMDKTDPKDAFILADLARVGRCEKLTPFKGPQKIALQRLTRHRHHIAELLAKEKVYALNNVFLKFSEFKGILSNDFSKTAIELLLNFKSVDEIINVPLEELVEFVMTSSKNRFADSNQIALTLKAAARNSYRLDKMAYEPINLSLAASFNCISTYQTELKSIDLAILKQVKGLNQNHYLSLISIPGIGPVYASGILAEIGQIDQFDSDDALAKYAGITWRKSQSGTFDAEDTRMTKTGNVYLRYFITEAANLARIHNPVFKEFYQKKFDEVKTHRHKRALALTARKLIRLIYGLLSTDRLYK